MIVGRAGAGFCDNPGDIIEVGDSEGQRMIEAGQGEELKSEFSSKNKDLPNNIGKKKGKK